MRSKVIAFVLLAAVPQISAAAPVPSRVAAEEDGRTVTAVIHERAVAERLAQLGYDSAAIQQRVEQLSPDDLKELASDLRRVQLAGATHKTMVVAGVIVTVVVVALILTALNHGPKTIQGSF